MPTEAWHMRLTLESSSHAALRAFAEREQRSTSNMVSVLVVDGLRRFDSTGKST